MQFPRILFLGSVVLFLSIAVVAGVKRWLLSCNSQDKNGLELTLSRPITPGAVDLIPRLFATGEGRLPIVETVVYDSAVPWLKGRPAWIGDYASHYATSRHFIARSLNGKADYFTQKVLPGQKFNVFRKDKNFRFYLLADLSRCKMAFYYIDLDANERVLLKTYSIGVGKKSGTASGYLTPTGRFMLGEKTAVYDHQMEMKSVFGTRWIPFGKEIGMPSHLVQGLGIHGAPWRPEGECREVIGMCGSEGSIQMTSEAMEELFAIVVTRPTVIEIVSCFEEAQIPGVERR